jgi:hypothetical protein
MKIDEINKLHEKANSRKDGVYSYNGNYWVVKNKSFVAYSDNFGNAYLRAGSFNVSIGQIEWRKAKETWKKWLKEKS